MDESVYYPVSKGTLVLQIMAGVVLVSTTATVGWFIPASAMGGQWIGYWVVVWVARAATVAFTVLMLIYVAMAITNRGGPIISSSHLDVWRYPILPLRVRIPWTTVRRIRRDWFGIRIDWGTDRSTRVATFRLLERTEFEDSIQRHVDAASI